MTVFVWTMLFLCAIELAVSLGHFASGQVPQRTRASMAANAAINGAVAFWALWLVARSAS